ncbi:hypothetical protein BHE90_017490, partial [Fusarium euwallaceae]
MSVDMSAETHQVDGCHLDSLSGRQPGIRQDSSNGTEQRRELRLLSQSARRKIWEERGSDVLIRFRLLVEDTIIQSAVSDGSPREVTIGMSPEDLELFLERVCAMFELDYVTVPVEAVPVSSSSPMER